MKETKQLLMTIAVLLYSITMDAVSEYVGTFEVDGICYELRVEDYSNLKAYVIFKGDLNLEDIDNMLGDYEGDVIIPESVVYNGQTYVVEGILNYAFANCTSLTSISIPKSVTRICSNAFRNCTSLTSLDIPEGVTNIEGGAFYNCNRLTSIDIPESVTNIGSSTFSGCSSLTSIDIPEGVTNIGESAFSGCSSLTSIDIPEGATNLGDQAFSGCNSLTSIDIPGSVTNVGWRAFYNCNSLASVAIPGSVTNIGNSAFANCIGLTSIDISEGVTNIGESAFSGCSSLTSIDIPESVTNIGESAFSGCSSLISVVISEGVTNIGNGAFANCIGLTSIDIPEGVANIGILAFHNAGLISVTIPESITNIGTEAFGQCYSLKNVYAHSLVSWCNIEFGSLGANPLRYATRFYINKSIVQGNLEIPSAITSLKPYVFTDCDFLESITFSNTLELKNIGEYAFFGCKGLTSIDIPESVTDIGKSAFSGCSSLTSVAIPEGVTNIGEYTFSDCSSLTSVSIPEGVASIGLGSFKNCNNLNSIIIPSSVTQIMANAFYNLGGLSTIICQAKNPPLIYSNTFSNQESCVLYVPEEALNHYQNDLDWGVFSNINAIIETIASGTCGDGLTWKFTSEDELIIEGTGNMDDFLSERPWDDYIASVKKITIAEGVTSIGGQSFKGCSSLESLNISNSVTSIGHAAFAATPLETIEISASVTSIKGNPFVSCPLLKSIIVDGENTVFDSREDCNAIIEKSTNSLISGCSTTVIPNDVNTICDDAFAGSSIENLTIPSSVQNIGKRVFKECEELASVVLGENVEIIGTEAFCGCNKLAEMKVKALIPPVVEDASAFNDSEGERLSISLLVPNAVLEIYRETDIWSGFMSIESYDVVVINDAQGSFSARSGNYEQITYTRTLNNTEWNALYLPFEIPVSQLTDKYEVAYINAIHSYDEDDNGEIDRMSMEVIKLREGTLHANHPYLIKARTAEAKQMSITVENTMLYKAESRTLNCSSVYTKFEITGVYEKMTSEQLAGCYALSGGSWKNLTSGSTLNPFRLYLRVSSREGSPVKLSEAAMARIGIHVQGEETSTSVEERLMQKQHKSDAIYDLSGRRVTHPKKGHIYIVNDKKRVY